MKRNYYPIDEELVKKYWKTCTHESYEEGCQTAVYRKDVDEVEKQWDVAEDFMAIKNQIKNLVLVNGLEDLDKNYYDSKEELASSEWMLIVNGTENAAPDYWTFANIQKLSDIISLCLNGYEERDILIISPQRTIFTVEVKKLSKLVYNIVKSKEGKQ